MSKMTRIRVLLADDNEEVLAHVRNGLSREFDVVGTAKNGTSAVAEVRRLKPDILVIDISMPLMSGLEAVSYLRPHTTTRIVFLTVHKGEDYIAAAFAAGASAYVAKTDVESDLVPAIMQALKGETFISESMTKSQ